MTPPAPQDLETLRRVSLAAARSAEQALNQMTSLNADLEVARVQMLPFADVPALLGGPESPVVGVHLRVYGDLRGGVLLALSPATAERLLGLLFPGGCKPLEAMEEMEGSALTELGNVLASSFLSALGTALGRSLVPSVPALAVDMAGAIVDVLLIEQGRRSDEALVLLVDLRSGLGLGGHLLMLPDPGSLAGLLEALREAGRR